jgi:hypothetical protein
MLKVPPRNQELKAVPFALSGLPLHNL